MLVIGALLVGLLCYSFTVIAHSLILLVKTALQVKKYCILKLVYELDCFSRQWAKPSATKQCLRHFLAFFQN